MNLIGLIKKIVFSRISICALGIILQLLYIASLFWALGTMFQYSYFGFIVVGGVTAMCIINSQLSDSYKLIWVFIVLAFPVFGCMVYFFYGVKRIPKHTLTAYSDSVTFSADDPYHKQIRYLQKCGFKAFQGDETRYFPNGESVFPEILAALDKAEHYIFIEFFILERGLMWDSILSILEKKAQQGVDVRVIYDDMGSLLTLPRNYAKTLSDKNISCRVFGRLKPLWSHTINNRDHRKIIVIDGKTAFTGGINLADEYINAYIKYGYWKDSAVMISGNAAQSFAVTFNELWSRIGETETTPLLTSHEQVRATSKGYVIPFFDTPEDSEPVSENIYLNLLNNAKRYVYITTPYLILDEKMKQALILAAKNGIDVRLITPNIPDKKAIFEVTRSNYRELIENGVRIFEFMPGFIHAKNAVCDDEIAVVGTINMDFRSLYLHYECGVVLYSCATVYDVRDDIISTLDESIEIGTYAAEAEGFFRKTIRAVLKFFSPIM